MAADITVLNCVCCVVFITYDPLCSIIMYCPAWQMLGLLADCLLQRSVCKSNKDIIIIIVIIIT